MTTCAYCGAQISQAANQPAPLDDTGSWAEKAREHGPDCEWIGTRAHQQRERIPFVRDWQEGRTKADCGREEWIAAVRAALEEMGRTVPDERWAHRIGTLSAQYEREFGHRAIAKDLLRHYQRWDREGDDDAEGTGP